MNRPKFKDGDNLEEYSYALDDYCDKLEENIRYINAESEKMYRQMLKTSEELEVYKRALYNAIEYEIEGRFTDKRPIEYEVNNYLDIAREELQKERK